ncbi:MAG: NRAMP family divalent metal transporter [Chitinophagales bacterium]
MNKSFLKTLGPGILFASTAIGVSHLVQSTRAGATYGFAMLIFVVAANLFKYPFFEYGTRYAAATGKSLIDGYDKLGKWMLGIYFLISLSSMFFVMAAVGFVTAGFMENLFGIESPTNMAYLSSLILLVICTVILALGKYKLLDNLIKVVGGVMLVSTLIAFVAVLVKGAAAPQVNFFDNSLITKDSLPFIIALMGWMPTAVDLSTWNSLWTIEKIKTSGYKPTVKEAVLEFNLGYWISALLSICFITLGAFLVFGTDTIMPDSKAKFAAQTVDLYTTSIGQWSYFIIAAAAFSIMLGTSIGVLDGYARSMSRTSLLLFSFKENKRNYTIWLCITALGGLLIISLFLKNLKALVDLATTISFLIAPFIAIINFKLVTSKDFDENARPNLMMRVLSWAGIVFLSGFSIFYIYYLFFLKV